MKNYIYIVSLCCTLALPNVLRGQERIEVARNTTVAAPVDTSEKVPFAFADFTWMNGQSRQREFPLTYKFITASINIDAYYNYNFANPVDNTQTISATVGRHNEVTLNMASIGLEAYYKGAIARVLFQTGAMANIIQDLDGTVGRGANLSVQNQRLVREATAGYHWNKWHGINFEMGIFMSYIGLESYMTYENWNYNRSLVCDFTPFYFSGVRLQMFPAKNLKIEPWIINGFQTYGKFNSAPAAGLSIYYRPSEPYAFVANFYYGSDYYTGPATTYGTQDGVKRFHHDHSILIRYVNKPDAKGISRMAFSINNHYGFQSGNINQVTAPDGTVLTPAGTVDAATNYMAGTSLVNRTWFYKNQIAFTLRGEYVTNPGRHIALYPIPGSGFPSGQTIAGYTVTPPAEYDMNYSGLKAWGFTAGLDVMPVDFVTFRLEYVHRGADIPWFTGRNGSTPTYLNSSPINGTYTPDLQKTENRITFAVNARI